jgi:hypothetical protein
VKNLHLCLLLRVTIGASSRKAETMKVDPKKWFHVEDSKVRDPDSGSFFYNVEARFADHPILDVDASRRARRNVYFYGVVMHTRVLKANDGAKAIANCTSHVMRLDKGRDETRHIPATGPEGNTTTTRVGKSGLPREEVDRCIATIKRCPEAWNYYQQFRKAPVTELETEILKIISQMPEKRNIPVIDAHGNTLSVDSLEPDHAEDDPDAQIEEDALFIEKPDFVEPSVEVPTPRKRGRPPRDVAI